MEVRWSTLARYDLDGILAYISNDSVTYAKAQVLRILQREDHISTHPFAGRVVPETRNEVIREIFEGNYRIIYKVRKHSILVLRVIHFARNYRP